VLADRHVTVISQFKQWCDGFTDMQDPRTAALECTELKRAYQSQSLKRA